MFPLQSSIVILSIISAMSSLLKVRDLISNEVDDKEKPAEKMTKKDKAMIVDRIEEEMKQAAKNLDFERAMELRDILFELKSN